jgi:hypothetical protein
MKKLLKLRLNKKKKRILIGVVTITFVLAAGFVIGYLVAISDKDRQPVNLIWTVDSSVYIPDDLRVFLNSQPACDNQLNPGIKGVRLWGVMQVYVGSYAKIAYGCSSELKSYIVASKQSGQWQLHQPENYFSEMGEGALPLCASVQRFNIPGEVEPFCINKGKAQANTL